MIISEEERTRALRIAKCDDIAQMDPADWEVYARLWQAQRDEMPLEVVAHDVTKRLHRQLLQLEVVR
jgi:hypothetical protein